MAEIKKYIAVDLGAESGRVMLGSVSARKLILEEIHRFSNGSDYSLYKDRYGNFHHYSTAIR